MANLDTKLISQSTKLISAHPLDDDALLRLLLVDSMESKGSFRYIEIIRMDLQRCVFPVEIFQARCLHCPDLSCVCMFLGTTPARELEPRRLGRH